MKKETAFILMPFADEFSDVYEYLISDALQGAGYTVNRADDIKSQSNIIGDIVEGIVNSDLVVADLTGANPNVYYELGIAHALNKKVILITQEIDELPFDLRSYRVISYNNHFIKMNQAKKELSELAIEAYNGNLLFGNPVKDFGKTNPSSVMNKNTLDSGEIDTQPEDLGVLDYQVALEDGFEEMGFIVTEVGEKLGDELTPRITKTSEKLKSNKLTTKQQRNIIRELAKHLQDYGVFIRPKNEKYRLLLKDVENSLETMLSGKFEIEGEEAKQELENFLNILSGVEEAAFQGRQEFTSLIETMETQPKIERDFNRSKTFMATELKSFVDNIDQTISVIERARRLGKSLVEKLSTKTD